MTIQEKVKAFMQETGVNQASLAKALGISSSKISQFLGGKYKGDVVTLEKDLKDYIKNFTFKVAVQDDFEGIHTENIAFSHLIINSVIDARGMGVVYGEAGCGKTQMIKSYINENPNHILIQASDGITTKDILRTIANAVGAVPSKNRYEMLMDITNKIKPKQGQGINKFIIVDEAENLQTSSLEALRRIWDFSRIPIILVGTYALLSNLKGRNGELLQLLSRISRKVEFMPMSEDEKTAIFGTLSKEIFRHTKNLRIAKHLYDASLEFARESGEEPSAKHVRFALSSVMIDC